MSSRARCNSLEAWTSLDSMRCAVIGLCMSCPKQSNWSVSFRIGFEGGLFAQELTASLVMAWSSRPTSSSGPCSQYPARRPGWAWHGRRVWRGLRGFVPGAEAHRRRSKINRDCSRQVWLGTSDDWIGTSDRPTKVQGRARADAGGSHHRTDQPISGLFLCIHAVSRCLSRRRLRSSSPWPHLASAIRCRTQSGLEDYQLCPPRM